MIGGHGINLMLPLKLSDRGLGHKNGVMAHLGVSPDAAELARTKDIAWIRKRRRNADRACLRIQLTIDKDDVPRVRIFIAVRKRLRQRNLGCALK